MKKIIMLVIILLLPVFSWAEYKIFLRNGSVILDVRSYDESGGNITVYFKTGSMVVPRQDILRIEGSEALESEAGPEETQPSPEMQEPRREIHPERESQELQAEREQPAGREAPAEEQKSDKDARLSEIKAELENIYSEFRQLEDEEARLVAEINEKRSGRVTYNKIQLNQLMRETEPLQQELFVVQQRKEELRQKRNSLEDELRTSQ